MEQKCPICKNDLKGKGERNDKYQYKCPMCGNFSILGLHVLSHIKNIIHENNNSWILFSHIVRKNTKNEEFFFFDNRIVDNIINESRYPTPQQQADNLILWLGNNLKFPGETTEISTIPFQAIIGAISIQGVIYILRFLIDKNLLLGTPKQFGDGTFVCLKTQLSFDGWQRYDELKRQSTDSYKAFMAMSFKPEFDAIFYQFKEAVKETGFELIRIDKSPKTGIIDNNMIVELRRARFIVTDCTGRNPGAYWEAGFAEGLGKKVFYTHSKEEFKEAHFDINHRFVIQWDKDNLSEAANELKSMIRAEIPGATMDDKPSSRE